MVLIASATLWWVGRTHANFYVMFISALLIGATLGFLRYNFPPARVFMGDTGSQFLGLALAAVSLLENRKGTATVTLLLPLVALAVPIADGVLAFLRRLVHGAARVPRRFGAHPPPAAAARALAARTRCSCCGSWPPIRASWR